MPAIFSGAMVAFGLGTLIAVSELVYNLLKKYGAAYLCWLGINLVQRPRQSMVAASGGQVQDNRFWRGLWGNLLNPKIGVFYVSFLPQFIAQGHSPLLWTFGLVGIHVVIGSLWSAVLITATRPLSTWLRRPGIVAWLDRTTGALFLFFALRLATSRL